jgi:hypothetical protein
MIDFATAKLVPISSQQLVGKTITQVVSDSVNVLLIQFDDATEVAIQCHHDFVGSDCYEIHQMEQE